MYCNKIEILVKVNPARYTGMALYSVLEMCQSDERESDIRRIRIVPSVDSTGCPLIAYLEVDLGHSGPLRTVSISFV